MKLSILLLFSCSVLSFDHEVSAYAELPLDQVAEESAYSEYGTRMKTPTNLFSKKYKKSYAIKRFEDQTRPKTIYRKYRPIRLHNQPIYNKPKVTSQTFYINSRKHSHSTHSHNKQPNQYKVATNIQILPDTIDSSTTDYGWIPIIPLVRPDESKQETRHNRRNSKSKQLYRKIQHSKTLNRGQYLTVHPKYFTYNNRRSNVNKVALKKENSSAFSHNVIHGISDSTNVKELDTAESHHVKYKTKIKHHHHHHHHKYVQTVIKKVPVKVPVKVIVPKPYPVEKKVPVEKIVHKYIEKKVPYPVEKKVPYPVEVKVPEPYPVKVVEKEYVPKPYPVIKYVPVIKHVEVKVPVPKPVPYVVEKQIPYPIEVKVPYPVEKKVPYTIEVEKKVPFPVKVYVSKPIPVEKKVPYPVEVKVKEPYPVIKHVPVPVKVFVDKPYPVPVLKPYPVEVEKKVPYPVEVEKKIPFPVKVYVPTPVSGEHSHSGSTNSESNRNNLFFGLSDFYKHSLKR